MLEYIVTFESKSPDSSDDAVYNFIDVQSFLGSSQVVEVSQDFILNLLRLIKKHNHYSILGNIKSIIAPSGGKILTAGIYALLGRVNIDGQKSTIGVLIKDTTKNIVVLGFYPEALAEFLGGNINKINTLLLSILNSPHDWDFMTLITPL